MVEREGVGWRLAWDRRREPFPLLIGGDGWACELTAGEGATLRRALIELRRQHRDLANTLMDEESICLEFQGSCPPSAQEPWGEEKGEDSLWVALEGDRRAWSLRFVLQPRPGCRGVEGSWSVAAAGPLLEAFIPLVELSCDGVSPDP